MKVCGFTFIRNAVKFDFPVVEAIRSILPLCDHFVVAVGNSDDGTRSLVEAIAPDKITIVDTTWDENLQRGGAVYAAETDKAFDAIPAEYDWCFYIQGDEVLHENFHPVVRHSMKQFLDRKAVDGLLFGYKHFYGSFDYIGDSRKWYRNEIRIIRNDKAIRSYRDAQGFRKRGKKLNAVKIEADMYHYGWVRSPKDMQKKINAVRKFYRGEASVDSGKLNREAEYNFHQNYDALAKFSGTHPKVMKERIERLNWNMEVDLNRIRMPLKYKILYYIEKRIGVRLFEYRNYRLLKA
jgi:hypothetical protein